MQYGEEAERRAYRDRIQMNTTMRIIAVALGSLLLLAVGVGVGIKFATPSEPVAEPVPIEEKAVAQEVTAPVEPQFTDEQKAHLRKLECLDWCYSESADEMTGQTLSLAYVNSDTELNLKFPYDEPQRATLAIRQHPRTGRGVIFKLQHGQIQCGSDGCSVLVRIDENQPRRWRASGPDDGGTNILFLTAGADLERQLIGAREIAIEVTLYQEGSRVILFRPRIDLVPPPAS